MPASMTLTYYGHCAFLWTSPEGVRVLLDPFGNLDDRPWFLRPFPPIESEIVVVTHDHFDHNEAKAIPDNPTILRSPGVFSHKDITLHGVADVHAGRSGLAGLRNVIFMVECEGVRYCHLGDNRSDMPGDVREQLGDVDVLMVTVDDSRHLLNDEQIDSVIAMMSPRIVVPMHYHIKNLTTDSSELLSPDEWLASQKAVRKLNAHTTSIAREDLPAEREVWVFEPLLP